MTYLLHGLEGTSRMTFEELETFLQSYGIPQAMAEDGSSYREMTNGRERMYEEVIVERVLAPRMVALEAMREGFNIVPLPPVLSLTRRQVTAIFTCPEVVTLRVN